MAAYFWQYQVDSATAVQPQTVSISPESVALSKDLKKHGWTFVGPTTVYAFMHAVGLVNDHAPECVIAAKVVRARKVFQVPTNTVRPVDK